MSAPHVSDYYTPLYDNERGGPPRAFRCEIVPYYDPRLLVPCARVTRTESGMLMHLRICHGIERQPRLFK
jgi:hypothetical protein